MWKAVLTLDRSRKMKVIMCYLVSLSAIMDFFLGIIKVYSWLIDLSVVNRVEHSASLLFATSCWCALMLNVPRSSISPTLQHPPSYGTIP